MSTPDNTTPRERRGFFAMIADIPGLIRELIDAEIESLKAEVIGKLKAAGIDEELVRLSLGIESAADIIDDLGQALRTSQKA